MFSKSVIDALNRQGQQFGLDPIEVESTDLFKIVLKVPSPETIDYRIPAGIRSIFASKMNWATIEVTGSVSAVAAIQQKRRRNKLSVDKIEALKGLEVIKRKPSEYSPTNPSHSSESQSKLTNEIELEFFLETARNTNRL